MSKSAAISTASSGASPLVAAPGVGKRIRVFGLFLVSTGANAVKFQSASTDLTGAMAFGANGGIVVPNSGDPWFECADNEALNINLSAATQVSGLVAYDVFPG